SAALCERLHALASLCASLISSITEPCHRSHHTARCTTACIPERTFLRPVQAADRKSTRSKRDASDGGLAPGTHTSSIAHSRTAQSPSMLIDLSDSLFRALNFAGLDDVEPAPLAQLT